METTPETSKHTSIQQRILCLIKGEPTRKRMSFVSNHRQNMPKGMAYSLIDYYELVDCIGQCIRSDEVGYIEHSHNPIHQHKRSSIPDRLELLTLKRRKEQAPSTFYLLITL